VYAEIVHLYEISHIYVACLHFVTLLYRIIDIHNHNRYQNFTVSPTNVPFLLYLPFFISVNPFAAQVVSHINIVQNLLCTFFVYSHASFNPYTSTPYVVLDSNNFRPF